MRNAEGNSDRLEITVSRLGASDQNLEVKDGTTIDEVLNCAGIDLRTGETVHVDGVEAKMEALVDDGDTIQIIGKKDGGVKKEEKEEEAPAPGDDDAPAEEVPADEDASEDNKED